MGGGGGAASCSSASSSKPCGGEGYELSVFASTRASIEVDPATGELKEPIEEVVIDLDEEHFRPSSCRRCRNAGPSSSRCGRPVAAGCRLVFHAPTRGPARLSGRTSDRHPRQPRS